MNLLSVRANELTDDIKEPLNECVPRTHSYQVFIILSLSLLVVVFISTNSIIF